jgi:RNA-binding protein
MELTERQRKYLRGLAHPLEPVIMVGNAGLTEGVVKETARALHDHELVKVKVRGSDRGAREQAFESLASQTGSALVHRIGHVGVLYLKNPKLAKIVIPDA